MHDAAGSCPKWMINYLNYNLSGNATFYPQNSSSSAIENVGNFAYWTSTARSDGSGFAWYITRSGYIDGYNTTVPNSGARPVVVVNKFE